VARGKYDHPVTRHRLVSFAEIFNFRDLGGYTAVDGRTVAWGRLFRSDNLGRLSDEDKELFAGLGIRTVVDLRRPEELRRRGRFAHSPGVAFHHLEMDHLPWPEVGYTTIDERVAYLVERYVELATMGAACIGSTLRLIADEDTAPLVFHCKSGKDRTGVVAALVLALLGVDDETIAADYALSEVSVAAYLAIGEREPEQFASSPPGAMLGFLAWLRATYGSVEAYGLSLGLTPTQLASLRAHLLTSPNHGGHA